MTTLRTGSNPVNVEASPRTLLRLRRMARELRLTDQILSYDLDCVTVVDDGRVGAPAWTSADGSTITVNVALMPDLMTRRGLAVWLGTNAHELFHNLFSPRKGSNLLRRIAAADASYMSGVHRSWNILEDQRIERLGLARYAAWRGYLIAALSHHIPASHEGAWPLLAGRTWLTDEVRALARAAFVATNGDALTRRAAELIGAYQRLADPGDDDSDEAWAIVDEFHRLFGKTLPPRGGCGNHPLADGEPEPGDEGDVSIPTADEADDDDGDDEGDCPNCGHPAHDGERCTGETDQGDWCACSWPDPDNFTGDEFDDDEGDDEGDDDGDTDADGDDGDGDDDDGDDGSDTDGDDGEGSTDGESMGDGDADTDDDDESDDDGEGDGESEQSGDGEPGDGVSHEGERTIEQAIRDAIDEALADDETAADLDRIADQVEHGDPGGGDLPRTTGQWTDLTPAARILARDVTQVLVDIRDDCEAAWVRRTDCGRFNVGRWATDPEWDADNVFDEFQPGAMDASALDVVLVLDVSGSMSSQIVKLAEATWAIRTAVDRVEGQCTVIGFGDGASMMFEPHQRPDGRIFVPHLEGSTNPTPGIREAHRIVAGSTATNRIVIVLTDGEWWDLDTAEAALRACEAEGATTCVVGLGTYARRISPGFCGAQVVERIFDSSELVPIFRTLAERSMLAAAGMGA